MISRLMPSVSFVSLSLPAAGTKGLALAGPVAAANAATVVAPAVLPAMMAPSGAEALSILSDFIRMEPAAGFLIGALLLGIATSLRLRVIRKSQSNTELPS